MYSVMAGTTIIPPPSIHHLPERPAHYTPIVERAAKNIHLRQQAARLLLLYAGQAEGFRPAQAFVESKIGIPKKKVSDVRKRLIEHGLICYDKGCHKIYIAWDRIRAFAMLDKPILLTRGQYTFFPFDPSIYLRRTTKHSFIKQHRIVPIPLTLEQERQLKVLELMPQKLYDEVLKSAH